MSNLSADLATSFYSPVPDRVYGPSALLREMRTLDLLPDKLNKIFSQNAAAMHLDPSIKNIRMSVKEVFIIDNRDWGKGDIYLTSLVTTSLSSEPFAIGIEHFQDIPDEAKLQIGPQGISIYRNKQGSIPSYLDYRIIVVNSDLGIRQTGDLIKEIVNTKSYQQLLENLKKMSSPQINLIAAAADLVMQIMSRVLRMNRDDQLIYILGSFDDAFDDLGTKLGVINQRNDYAKVLYQVEAV